MIKPRVIFAFLSLGVVLSGAGCGQNAAESSSRPGPIHEQTLQLVDLMDRPCDAFAEVERNATVFVFVRTDCPIANRYAPELQRLQQRYSELGVEWVLVYPDPDESAESVRAHLQEFGYACRALRDPRHELVRVTGAQVTPEVAVFSKTRALVYCGRIDDRFPDFGQARPEPTVRDLADALDATLAGREVAQARTKAVGCYISDLQ